MQTVLSGPNVILALKVAVAAVTLLLLASLAALALGKVRLHGRINIAFFALTVTALIAFEVVIRFLNPGAFDYINGNDDLRRALDIHLCFSVPSALLMPVMLYTGLTRRRQGAPGAGVRVRRPVDRHVHHRRVLPAAHGGAVK